MTEATTDIATQQAVSPQQNTVFRTDFEIKRELPDNLNRLISISANFYWSWQPEGAALFRELDPWLWDKCEQNPRVFLKKIKELRLWHKSPDANYVERVGAFNRKFERYIAENRQPQTVNIAYFCAEYGVHNSLPNYSGGLGILAGDHLKSASDLNLPLTAIGLLYRYGYFRQKIRHDGWQEEIV